VHKGDDADEWLTGVLGGEMGFLWNRHRERMDSQAKVEITGIS